MTRGAIGKGLALCSSILLAGCFVAYRQNQAKQPDAPAVLPGSKNPASSGLVRWPDNPVRSREGSDFVSPQAGPPDQQPATQKTVFPSSKSIDSILRTSDLPGASKAPSQRAVLPGSKSLVIPGNNEPINRNDIDAILNGERKSAKETKDPQPEEKP